MSAASRKLTTREALKLVEEWREEAYLEGDSDRLTHLNRIKYILLSEN